MTEVESEVGESTTDGVAVATPSGPPSPGGAIPSARARSRSGAVLTQLERFGLVGLWGVVVLIFSLLAPQSFPTVPNFSTIFGTQAVLLVLSLGLIVALAVAEYDLSVGAAMGFATVVVSLLSAQDHWPLWAAIVFTFVLGLAIGVFNAVLVVRGGISSFVVTLGTGTLLTGLAFGISNSETIGGVPSALITGTSKEFLDLPLAFFYGVALCLVLWYVFNYTPLGRHLVFVGEGREVARLSGLRVQRIRFGALVACTLIATLAGILEAGVVGAADPSGGPTFLLPAFASAFLGATAVRPGRFNAWGTFVAVYFLVTGITGLQLLGYTGWVQDVWYGASLVVAVAVARYAAARRRTVAGT